MARACDAGPRELIAIDRESGSVLQTTAGDGAHCRHPRPGKESAMSSVRFHVSGGRLWALCKCDACGDIDRYEPAEAVICRRCGARMPIDGALLQAMNSGAIPNRRETDRAAFD